MDINTVQSIRTEKCCPTIRNLSEFHQIESTNVFNLVVWIIRNHVSFSQRFSKKIQILQLFFLNSILNDGI